MENNQIYSSVDDNQIDGTIFVVDIEENETSMRLKLKGEYSLRIWDGGLSLLSLNTEQALYYWPFTVLRRYGTSKSGFTFEAGRKSHAGPGVLRFSSPSGKLITQTIKETVNKIKGYNCTSNTDSSLVHLPSVNNNCQLGEEISGDYTKYSKTTDRPKRKVKAQEPHIELSLEIPAQYNSNRLAAGHSLSNPVSHGPPKERSKPPVTYYNENFNRPVGPSFDYNDNQSLGQTASLDYIGDTTGLSDNYSLPTPQESSLTIISNAPIPLARTKSPSIPDPYKSINRALPHQDTLTSSAEQFIKSEESIMSATSTFPTCVSPLPKAHSSAEDSSSEDEITKKPAIRKISQAQTSRTELTADLELKAIDRNSPVSENYVNLRKEPLLKTLSNPGEIRSKDEFKLVGTEHHNYINISRQHTTEPQSDYYNITPDMLLPDEKRRSYTDTNQRKKNQQPHFNFSPSYNNRGDILEGPSSLSNMQNILSDLPESEDILYGNFQMHPSSHPANTQQLYVNTQANSKPIVDKLIDTNNSSAIECNYTFQSDISFTTNYTLPIALQEPPSNPRQSYETIGVKTAQPKIPKQNPRPYSNRKIPSEYSYLTEVLKQAPSNPKAYNTCRGLPTENK